MGGKSVADAMAIANDMINNVGFDMPDVEMVERTIYTSTPLPPDLVPEPGKVVNTNMLS
jgi:hypothetical protein